MNNSQTYRLFEDDYTAAAQRTQLRTYYDDDTRRTTGYDVADAQTYATYEEDYNMAGQRGRSFGPTTTTPRAERQVTTPRH